MKAQSDPVTVSHNLQQYYFYFIIICCYYYNKTYNDITSTLKKDH